MYVFFEKLEIITFVILKFWNFENLTIWNFKILSCWTFNNLEIWTFEQLKIYNYGKQNEIMKFWKKWVLKEKHTWTLFVVEMLEFWNSENCNVEIVDNLFVVF